MKDGDVVESVAESSSVDLLAAVLEPPMMSTPAAERQDTWYQRAMDSWWDCSHAPAVKVSQVAPATLPPLPAAAVPHAVQPAWRQVFIMRRDAKHA